VDQDLDRLAGRFLEFVHQATRLPMIVCDEKGIIVHAVDRGRIGSPHAFARRIMDGEADELFVTAEDAARDARMKEGCNCVIAIDGERVGTFGLAGPLQLAEPLTRIASAVIVSWVKDRRRQAELERTASQVLAGVRGVTERTAAVGRDAAAAATERAQASADALSKLERSGAMVRAVQEVAQKTRILSINGSVEASRSGEHGRAFAVVAREMLALSEDARTAAQTVQTTLAEVEGALVRMQEANARSEEAARTQSAALEEIRRTMEDLQRAVAALARGG
jgi:sugar diacid utilization regulator